MNFINKLIVGLIISTPVFALQPIADKELGFIEGQSGITVEIQQHGDSSIGSIAYTDGDGDGVAHTDAAGIYLSDITIGQSSMKVEMDILEEGTLNIKISDINQGDLWVRNLAMGDEDTSFGAFGITNFDYDKNGSYNIQFATIDPRNDGNTRAGIVLDFDMASSSYDFIFIDEAKFDDTDGTPIAGNTIAYHTQFSVFKAEKTKVYADDIVGDGNEWVRVDLGSISGAAELQNISFGSIGGASEILGTAGFTGIDIQNSSFIAISAH
jgi:hypothetical protein